MTIIHRMTEDKEVQVRNRWVYPPNCETSPPDDTVIRTMAFRHWAEYVPEHRPYPSNLTENLTGRELVYRRSGTSPSIWYKNVMPCPHNGVHGNIISYHYLTGGSSLMTNLLYDADELEGQQMWASKLREKIGADKVNLGSSLAEYRETGKMFVKAAHSIHDAYKVLRGRMPRKKLRACSIPASVLQYNFGVAPLVDDLYSSVEQLRLALDKPLDRRLSVGIKKTFTGEFLYGPYSYKAKGTFSERATVYFTVIPSQYISNDFDFGNPVEWAWELIPFSFVVDWAIPIGEWLGQLDALQGISNIRGTVTRKTVDNFRYSYNPETGYNMCDRDGTFSGSTYKRTVISDIPLPSLPRWSPSLTGKRVINAVSLLLGISSTCRKG